MKEFIENELEQVSGGMYADGSLMLKEMQEVADRINRKFSGRFHDLSIREKFYVIQLDFAHGADALERAIKHCEDFALSDRTNSKLYSDLRVELVRERNRLSAK